MRVIINNRNYLTWPKAMADWLSDQGHDVYFLDNNSSYPPLLDWYDICPYKVYSLPNLGKTALWDSGLIRELGTDYFVLTDPDYDLSEVPADWPDKLMEGLALYPHVSKCGLSWDESRVPPENPAWTIDNFCNEPNGTAYAWGKPLPGNFFNTPCDTSFAIYRPNSHFQIDGIRAGRPYTAIHLPWHITLEESSTPGKLSVIMNDEIHYYFSNVENSSYTHGRLVEMIAEYERRVGIRN